MTTPTPGAPEGAPVQDAPGPGWQPLVPQSSDAMRVVRGVLAALVVLGWLRDQWHLTPDVAPGLTFAWSWAGAAGFGAFLVLVFGPAPRLATRWAWFWLSFVSPLAVAFLLLEPVPLWLREPLPARRRLSGGLGLLLAIGISIAISAVHAMTSVVGAPIGWLGLPF